MGTVTFSPSSFFMSDALTLDQLNTALAATENRFETKLTDSLAATEKRIGKKIDDATVPYFTALKTDLNQISDQLDRIEKLLWQGERLREIEDRVIKIAEVVGDASLARPFTRPVGS